MLDYALKNLRARKTRTTLCVLAIVVCVFLIATVDGMLSQMRDGFLGELTRHMGKASLQQSGSSYPPFNSTLNETIAVEVLKRNDIISGESTALLYIIVEPAIDPMSAAEVLGIGIEPGKEKAYLLNTKAQKGNIKLVDDSVILGSRVYKHYKKEVGEEIVIKGFKAKVVGILEQTNQETIDKAMLLPLGFAQKAFAKEHMVSSVLLTAAYAQDVENLAEELESTYPSLEVATQKQVKENIEKIMEMPNKFMGMISATIFVVAIVVMMNVMVMAIMERKREIGILRAMGARKKSILLSILAETLMLSLAGGILGLGVTIPVAYMQEWVWILSNKEMAKVDFLIFVIGILSGLYPAYKAMGVDPLEAIRYE